LHAGSRGGGSSQSRLGFGPDRTGKAPPMYRAHPIRTRRFA